MKTIKSFVLEITFFCLGLVTQLLYFRVSVPLDSVQLKDLLYLLVVETFVFVLYLALRQISFLRLTSDDHFIPVPLKVMESIDKLQSEIHELENNHDALIESNRESLDIVYGYVHELKTPITAIKMSSPTNLILQEVIRLEDVVEKLLYSSKISDIQNDLFVKNYELDLIVNELVRKHKNLFIIKKIRLEKNVNNFDIYTDKKWLIFALTQFLSNALKYTSNNGLIKIYTDKRQLIIEDNGCGIPKEYIHRVFDKGFTLNQNSRNYKGTGIGLYISKKILKHLNVECELLSQVDEGTTIVLTFKSEVDLLNLT